MVNRLVFFLSFLFALNVQAFEVPALTGPIVDEVGLVGSNRGLETLIRQANEEGVAQIQVVILKSLDGLSVEEASIQITDKWKLGSAQKDNGVLFLVAPNDRKMRIEVGQGLEGAIPDVVAKRILRDFVAPEFRQRNYDEGLRVGVEQILSLARGEIAPSARPKKTPLLSGFWVELFLFFLFTLFPLLGFIFRVAGGRGYSGRRGWGGGYIPSGRSWGGGGSSWGGGGGGFSGGGASGGW